MMVARVGSHGSPDAFAVIGAGYGDEGKGLVTDFLSSFSTRVVRFNGGAQAAHTVARPDGTRHIFHHVGSGCMRGATTHLSRFFVANPILALRELRELSVSCLPAASVTIDPRAMVTTPVDMMINQALEQKRGDDRHGSCGIGFGETIERRDRGLRLTVADLPVRYKDGSVRERLRSVLKEIRDTWVPARCEELGINPHELPDPHGDVDDQFFNDCELFTRLIGSFIDEDIAEGVDRVVFRGGAGTRSRPRAGSLSPCHSLVHRDASCG